MIHLIQGSQSSRFSVDHEAAAERSETNGSGHSVILAEIAGFLFHVDDASGQ